MAESTAQPSMTDTDAAPRARGRASQVLVVLARITAGLVVVQFALAGLGAFRMMHHVSDDDAYGAHSALGYAIGLLTLVLLVVALVARSDRRTVVVSVVLAVLAVPVQPLLAQLGHDTSAWIGLVHALNGVAIGGLTGALASGPAARRR